MYSWRIRPDKWRIRVSFLQNKFSAIAGIASICPNLSLLRLRWPKNLWQLELSLIWHDRMAIKEMHGQGRLQVGLRNTRIHKLIVYLSFAQSNQIWPRAARFRQYYPRIGNQVGHSIQLDPRSKFLDHPKRRSGVTTLGSQPRPTDCFWNRLNLLLEKWKFRRT